MKHIINTENAPAPIGPYNQAVKSGHLLYTSGQIPIDPATGEMVAGGVREQSIQVMENLKNVLEAAGCTLDDVIKTTVFLADMADFPVLNTVYAESQRALAAASRVFEMIDHPRDVVESRGASTLGEFSSRVEFRGVGFAYADGAVLSGIDLTIERGTTVALVGRSGAGKSTLARMLLRFDDPQVGRILFDGHDLREVTLKSLRDQIGLASVSVIHQYVHGIVGERMLLEPKWHRSFGHAAMCLFFYLLTHDRTFVI